MKKQDLKQLANDSKRSLEIIAEIEKLEKDMESITRVEDIKYFDADSRLVFKASSRELKQQLKNDFVDRANKKIASLEEELKQLWTKN